MTAPPPSKRRRADPAAALLKPFKPPLRTAPRATAPASPSSAPPPFPLSPAAAAASPYKALAATNPPFSAPADSEGAPTTPAQARPAATRALKSTSSPLHGGPASPQLAAARAQLAATRVRLAAARAELDTARQAARIERGGRRDAELDALTARWRGAARAAADELYAQARDRVCGMGGLGAWRARERERQRDFEAAWGGEGAERGGGDGEEEGEGRDEREDERGGGEEEKEEEAVDEEMGFTMDMMLKSLNIDLNVIGYDREMQRWVD